MLWTQHILNEVASAQSAFPRLTGFSQGGGGNVSTVETCTGAFGFKSDGAASTGSSCGEVCSCGWRFPVQLKFSLIYPKQTFTEMWLSDHWWIVSFVIVAKSKSQILAADFLLSACLFVSLSSCSVFALRDVLIKQIISSVWQTPLDILMWKCVCDAARQVVTVLCWNSRWVWMVCVSSTYSKASAYILGISTKKLNLYHEKETKNQQYSVSVF